MEDELILHKTYRCSIQNTIDSIELC